MSDFTFKVTDFVGVLGEDVDKLRTALRKDPKLASYYQGAIDLGESIIDSLLKEVEEALQQPILQDGTIQPSSETESSLDALQYLTLQERSTPSLLG